jgi:proteic killer suppression protein
MVRTVVISKRAQKDLDKVPGHIEDALATWVKAVKLVGLAEVRKVSGYHDEPLKGDRKGQRSIRLSKAYRAIYVMREDGVVYVEIIEVNKHKY